MPRLTVVHRQDCELCDRMVAELTALARQQPLPPLVMVDVDADAELARRFGWDVPVLLLDGAVVCKHRLDLPGLLERLREGC
jgi:hypothetical protein